MTTLPLIIIALQIFTFIITIIALNQQGKTIKKLEIEKTELLVKLGNTKPYKDFYIQKRKDYNELWHNTKEKDNKAETIIKELKQSNNSLSGWNTRYKLKLEKYEGSKTERVNGSKETKNKNIKTKTKKTT